MKNAGPSPSVLQVTRSPPARPASVATNVSSGMVMIMAMKRGSTSASKGSTPITCMASTSWFIFIEPSSAAKAEADRPASNMAVITMLNSRSTATPISSTA